MYVLHRGRMPWCATAVMTVVVLHSHCLFADTEARLLDLQSKVKSARPDLRYCHFGMLDAPAGHPIREAWIALDGRGNVSAIQVNLRDKKQRLVWTEEACQTWRFYTNDLAIFRDRLHELKMLSFANRHHPVLVYTRLHKLLSDPDIEVRVSDANEAPDPVTITVTYGADKYLVGTPKTPMRDVYTVDPGTGRLSQIEVYQFIEGEYRKAATWVYLDDAKPADPSTFDLRRQIQGSVRVTDTSHVEQGLKQGASSDEEVATRIVEAFLTAWQSQDTASIRKLMACSVSSDADGFCGIVMKYPPPRVIRSGAPVKKVPYLGFFVPVTVELAGDPPKQGQIMFLASPKHRDHWHIADLKFEWGESRED